jgi:hypothetical protein
MALKGDPATWSNTDRQGVIYAALAEQDAHVHVPGTLRDEAGKSKRKCATCRAAARTLFHRVGEEPLIFKSGGAVMPKGKARWERFMNTVGEIHAYVVAESWLSEPSEAPEAPPVPEADPEPSEAPHVPETPVPVRPPSANTFARDAERLYSEIQKRRAFVRGRKGMESLDSMRIVIDGVKAVREGIPVEAILSAIEAPWTAETRLQCAAYRPSASELKPRLPEGTYDFGSFAPRPSRFAHSVSAYVDRAIAAGLLVWLHGPAGTGKSSAAKHAAERHAERRGLTGEHTGGRTYFEVNCAGAMVSAVKGRDRLNDTVVTDFMLAYEHGGTVNLEEFDGAHPSVGTFLGTALAAPDGFVNDVLNRWVKRHPDFRCIVTANSLGYGDPAFKRNDLDAATKDRFRAGRVYTGLDLELERNIFNSMLEAA